MQQITNETPVACTLGSAKLGTQVERWDELYAEAGAERRETDEGLRVSFRRAPGVERELRDLVAVETECCAWADWTVQADADELVLEVTSREDGLPVLHSWFLAG
ncbi:MAG TPA: hypothetical protein VF101_14855 [Gaiellaceae bacterium]